MNKLSQLMFQAEHLIQEAIHRLNKSQGDFFDIEKEVLHLINRIGDCMIREIINEVDEPTYQNEFYQDGNRYYYAGEKNLNFINRFGGQIKKLRRSYKDLTNGGTYCPLDDRLGYRNCKRYSPLMTYLQSIHGCEKSYEASSFSLSQTLGFKVSSTAVQNNTEHIGRIIPEDPEYFIESDAKDMKCEVMIAEVDGTMSPQISDNGKIGRASLKSKTEYKECNIIAVKKQNDMESKKYYGGLYGKRKGFKNYCESFAKALGVEKVIKGAFLGDGAHNVWEIGRELFPHFIHILDFYHATEHISDFCDLFKDKCESKSKYDTWKELLYYGQAVQMIKEMKSNLSLIPKKDLKLAQREIKYFEKNKDKMNYLEYRNIGFPIGSGMVEAGCKLVVNRRFKGNGMRWKKEDNSCVLRVRLAFLNNDLEKYFHGNLQQQRAA